MHSLIGHIVVHAPPTSVSLVPRLRGSWDTAAPSDTNFRFDPDRLRQPDIPHAATFRALKSRLIRRRLMRGKKLVIYCEACGSDALGGAADFIAFHHLSFCSPDCRDAYRDADELRRAEKERLARRIRASKAA